MWCLKIAKLVNKPALSYIEMCFKTQKAQMITIAYTVNSFKYMINIFTANLHFMEVHMCMLTL